MSALAKLEEIEKRIAGATPGPWDAVTDGDPRGQPVPYYAGLVALIERNATHTLAVVAKCGQARSCEWGANQQLIAHAPADLALLAALVRSVAEEPCDGASEGLPDEVWECSTHLANCEVSTWCRPCRIRREISNA